MKPDRRRFLAYSGAALTASQLVACGRSLEPTAGVPRSRFDEDSSAEEVLAGIDLSGKVAVVTGCSSGIGLETMRVLAAHGAYVVGSSRSIRRAEDACRGVVGVTSPVQLDLGDLDSVVACAETILAMRTPIDMLICNAGYLGGANDRRLINGVEKHFAINHLGHFVLVNRVLQRLFIAEQARIVMVSSRRAYTDAPERGILFDDLGFQHDYDDLPAYAHSKLANALFSLRLSELLRGTRITSNALHPGVIDTDIDRNANAVQRFGLKLVAALAGKTIPQGAATSCYVATAEALGATSGAFFEDCNAVTIGGEHHLYDRSMAARLMQVSEELTSDYLVEQKIPDKEDFKR